MVEFWNWKGLFGKRNWELKIAITIMWLNFRIRNFCGLKKEVGIIDVETEIWIPWIDFGIIWVYD